MSTRHRSESGQSFVELAIGLVVLIVILGGLFDVGRAFLILVSVENAAGEGALYAAVHPECLTTDHAADLCLDSDKTSIPARVREEGKPVITLTSSNSTITVVVEGSGAVIQGNTVRVQVEYKYSPATPIGHLLWGSTAKVIASARQEILSPPPPGYKY